jgi:hypothetical protein
MARRSRGLVAALVAGDEFGEILSRKRVPQDGAYRLRFIYR